MSLLTTASPKNPKVDSHLVELSAADEDQRAAGGVGVQAANLAALPNDLRSMVAAGLMRIDDSGGVQVYVHSKDDVTGSAEAVQAAGGVVQREDAHSGLVQALVPISQVKNLAASSSVKFVRLPDYGVPSAGAVTTQGDFILKANLARADHGIDGSGVRVGVISGGYDGLAASQASGDLPSVNLGCNFIASSGGEGTAMMEIVHDLAPGAALWFASAATSLDFNADVNCLASNADVVVDDISFLGAGPYDGTSAVSANTNSALNNGLSPIRAYVTDAGNFATQHYQEPYQACDGGTIQLFSATASTVDFAGIGSQCYDPIVVPANETISAYLEWSDPWGASCNDYNLYLFTSDLATILASSHDPQTCSQHPIEKFSWHNPQSTSVVVDLAIDNYNGLAASRNFDLFVSAADSSSVTINFYTPFSSIPQQADAGGGVVTVGAINASDPGNDTIESYSGLGPTNDNRIKPDITGIDCVSVTGNGGFPSNFCGTSAAAPHIAGIAALLLQCKPSLKAGEPGDNPSADRAALRTGLLSYAVDLGPAGPDDIFGTGREDAQASANAVCPSTTPTPSPSPSPTPTHSPTPTPTPSVSPHGSASNFRWYQNQIPLPNPSQCDLNKPVPPNIPLDAGLCITNDLEIADGTYALEFVLRRNGVIVADQSFADVHLYSGNWSKSFDPPAPGGTYNLQLFVDGVLIGESTVLVPGPTPTPTPTPATITRIWGDPDCNGSIAPRDGQAILNHFLGNTELSQSQPCPAVGDTVTIDGVSHVWGDVDCGGSVAPRDGQAILNHFLSNTELSQTQPCPAVGETVAVGAG